MTGWSDGLGPWLPVLRGDKLYGRGGDDAGSAIFGSLAAIRALQSQGIEHSRCVIVIEACEDSGSYDLTVFVEHLDRESVVSGKRVCVRVTIGGGGRIKKKKKKKS